MQVFIDSVSIGFVRQADINETATMLIVNYYATLVARDTPLRLKIAAKIAFPDGSMTVSGLRREAKRGKLTIERISGKDFTTLGNIDRMRELCRVQAKVPDFTNEGHDIGLASLSRKPSGSSKTATDISPQAALRERLKQSHIQKLNPPK
jgi:hypothetical protein